MLTEQQSFLLTEPEYASQDRLWELMEIDHVEAKLVDKQPSPYRTRLPIYHFDDVTIDVTFHTKDGLSFTLPYTITEWLLVQYVKEQYPDKLPKKPLYDTVKLVVEKEHNDKIVSRAWRWFDASCLDTKNILATYVAEAAEWVTSSFENWADDPDSIKELERWNRMGDAFRKMQAALPPVFMYFAIRHFTCEEEIPF